MKSLNIVVRLVAQQTPYFKKLRVWVFVVLNERECHALMTSIENQTVLQVKQA